MTWIAGVDGCKFGWIAVLLNTVSGERELRLLPSFEDVVRLAPTPATTAVDMPIGLFEEGVPRGRLCDVEARRLLGKPRSNSVFPPPSRRALRGRTFEEAKRLNGAAGLTLQSFCLFPKLLEADAAMTPRLQERIREVHPEVSFFFANGEKAMLHPKKKPEGREERAFLLKRLEGEAWRVWWESARRRFPRAAAAEDDILDACVACWSAGRIFRGEAVRIPENPPLDARSLRMEIRG